MMKVLLLFLSLYTVDVCSSNCFSDDLWQPLDKLLAPEMAYNYCKADCEMEGETYLGLKRNGPTGVTAQCYCGSEVSVTRCTSCSHTCGGYPCGQQPSCMSVYSVAYPLCVHLSWPEVDCSVYEAEGGDCAGFPHESTISSCENHYRKTAMTTFYGVRRNGPSGNYARCYCGDSVDDLVDGATCPHRCNDLPCGDTEDSDRMSVYPACPEGKYGENCDLECPDGYCKDFICVVNTGLCPGECMDGWYGDNCNTACSVNCEDGCDQSGICQGCNPGFHENNCEQNCSKNCVGNICDQQSAECINGCQEGAYGPKCEQQCSSGCNNTACLENNGTCLYGCTVEFYGDRCESPCPVNCLDGCGRVNGSCFVCRGGWTGNKCDQDIDECSDGGSNTCNNTGACHNIPGSYKCCLTDDIFDDEEAECEQSTGSNSILEVGPIAGIAVGIVVIITLSVVLAIMLTRKKSPGEGNAKTRKPVNENMEDGSPQRECNPVGVYEDPLYTVSSEYLHTDPDAGYATIDNVIAYESLDEVTREQPPLPSAYDMLDHTDH